MVKLYINCIILHSRLNSVCRYYSRFCVVKKNSWLLRRELCDAWYHVGPRRSAISYFTERASHRAISHISNIRSEIRIYRQRCKGVAYFKCGDPNAEVRRAEARLSNDRPFARPLNCVRGGSGFVGSSKSWALSPTFLWFGGPEGSWCDVRCGGIRLSYRPCDAGSCDSEEISSVTGCW